MKACLAALVLGCATSRGAVELSPREVEQFTRSEHISALLVSYRPEDAAALSEFYQRESFRPEAAWYWATVAQRLGHPTTTAATVQALRKKVFQAAYEPQETSRMPEALKHPKFQKARAAVIGKAASGDLAAITDMRAWFQLETDFAEEMFFWSTEEFAQKPGADSPRRLLDLEKGCHTSPPESRGSADGGTSRGDRDHVLAKAHRHRAGEAMTSPLPQAPGGSRDISRW